MDSWTLHPMPDSQRLTDKLIAAIKPADKIYDIWDSDVKGFVLRIHPSGIKSFRYSYRVDGNRKTYTIGKFGNLTTAQAREHVKIKAAEVLNGIDVQAEKIESRKPQVAALQDQTLAHFIDTVYAPWRNAHRKDSDSSIRRLLHNFKDLLPVPLNAITANHALDYQTKRINAGIKPTTINRDMNELRACLTHAVDREILSKSPLEHFSDLKSDKMGRVRWLLDDEEIRLRSVLAHRDADIKAKREHANQLRTKYSHPLLPSLDHQAYGDHMTPMTILSFLTGLRRGELFGLTWKDIDFKTCNVRVQGSGSKSGNTRFIPLCKEAVEVLHAWRAQTTSKHLVFENEETGAAFTTIKTAWGRIVKLAELEDFTWHDLRHDFGSKLAMAGVSLYTIKDLMGHASIETTQIYAHLSPQHKHQSIAALDRRREELQGS